MSMRQEASAADYSDTAPVSDERFEKARKAIDAAYKAEMENLKFGRLRDMTYMRDTALMEKRIDRKHVDSIIDEYKSKRIDAEEMFERLNGYFLNDEESHRTYDVTVFEMVACALKDEIASEFKEGAYDRRDAISITDIGLQRILASLMVKAETTNQHHAKLMVQDFVANLREVGRDAIGASRGTAR